MTFVEATELFKEVAALVDSSIALQVELRHSLVNWCSIDYLFIVAAWYAETSFTVLANLRSRSLYAVARPSVVCLSSVCLSSVTLVHPTQPIVIFGNISTALGTLAIH